MTLTGRTHPRWWFRRQRPRVSHDIPAILRAQAHIRG